MASGDKCNQKKNAQEKSCLTPNSEEMAKSLEDLRQRIVIYHKGFESENETTLGEYLKGSLLPQKYWDVFTQAVHCRVVDESLPKTVETDYGHRIPEKILELKNQYKIPEEDSVGSSQLFDILYANFEKFWFEKK